MKQRKSIFHVLICCITSILLFFSILSSAVPVFAADQEGAVINIVYDDSGSMYDIITNTWSQAKYATEIFSAMMGQNDTVNIFPMKNYENLTGAVEDPSRYLTLNGNAPGQERVNIVEQIDGGSGTPFNAVLSAGDVLKSIHSSDKWLIILTDGDFDCYDDYVLSQLQGYLSAGIRIVFISINRPNPFTQYSDGQNFITYTTDSDQILETVTETAQRIFSLQQVSLSQNGNNYSFFADIPLSKLIILAQGKEVKVEDLMHDGQTVSENSESITVEVLENHAYKPSINAAVAPGLEGKVKIYKSSDESHPMEPGNYSFNTNASNVQVFFEPGIDIQAFLYAGSDVGEQNILDIDKLEASDSPLVLKIINPLTGEEIDKDQSDLLEGASISLYVVDEQGNRTEYKDGDTIHLVPGNVTMEAIAVFPSKVRKSTGEKNIAIVVGQPLVQFSSQTGYSLNANTLELDLPLEFTITHSDGSKFALDELEKLDLQMQNTPGLSWSIQLKDAALGLYEATPSYSGGGSGELSSESMQAELAVSEQDGKGPYIFKTQLVIDKDIPVDLQLEIETPVPEIQGKDQLYMFDPNELGAQKGAPYLAVKVSVINPDGSLRPLNSEEWELGLNGFTYEGVQTHPDIFSWICKTIYWQKISFEPVKGDEVSTYRLYLTGNGSRRILPGDIDLLVSLTIQTPAGFPETGEADTKITVQPLSILTYLGWILFWLLIVVLLLVYLYASAAQKKLPKDFHPHSLARSTKLSTVKTKNDVTPISKVEINRHRLNRWKPQTATVRIPLNKVFLNSFPLEVKAEGGTSIQITNIDAVAVRYPRAIIGHQTAEEWAEGKKPCILQYSQILTFPGKKDKELIVLFKKPKT